MTSLQSLRSLAMFATSGPWMANHYYECVATHSATVPLTAICYRGKGPNWVADIDFIAACDPQTIMSILDRLDALEKVAEAGRMICSEYPEDRDGMDYRGPLPFGVKSMRLALQSLPREEKQ